MTAIPDDLSFEFEPSIDELCELIISTTDKLHHTLQCTILHLTASASVDLHSVPDPSSDPNKTLQNPFVLNAAPPSSTTLTSHLITLPRAQSINSVLNTQVERDRNTFLTLQIQLHDLIHQLQTAYPIPSTPPTQSTDTQLTSEVSIQSLTIHNINSLPIPTLNSLINSIPLEPKSTFPSQSAYIDYLKQHKTQLYTKVKQQYAILHQLHKQAVSLQQSLSLYRGQ
jgi:hypothetical protein